MSLRIDLVSIQEPLALPSLVKFKIQNLCGLKKIHFQHLLYFTTSSLVYKREQETTSKYIEL